MFIVYKLWFLHSDCCGEWLVFRYPIPVGELQGDYSTAWNPSRECVSVPSLLCSKKDIWTLGKRREEDQRAVTLTKEEKQCVQCQKRSKN